MRSIPLLPALSGKHSRMTRSALIAMMTFVSFTVTSVVSLTMDCCQEDGFGPFSDSAAAAGSSSDPFTFASSSFSSYSSDDSFDFGDFQSGDSDGHKDGELTPTAGSWTFASGSETEGDSEGDDFGSTNGNRPKNGNGLQTISLDDVNDRFENKKQAWNS